MATLTEAKAQLAAWEATSLALSQGKAVTHGDRRLELSDIQEVRSMITYWGRQVADLEASSRGRVSRLGSIATFPDYRTHR